MIAYLILTVVVWLTYSYLFSCTWVSDDLQGIIEYDGKLGTTELSIFGRKLKLPSYGSFMKWFKFHLCGGNFPSARKDKSGNSIPIGKTPRRYHALQIIIFNVGLLFLYTFLLKQFDEATAFYSCLMIAVFPLGAQVVSWNSAIGYTLCFLWTAIELVFVQWFMLTPHSWLTWLGAMILFSALHFLAVNALFSAVMTSLILFLFGWWQFALVGGVVAGLLACDIIFHTISYRADEFKKQAMGHATGFRPRKFIVAIKTFQYYMKMLLFPRDMGLYHTWGYHYSADIERENHEMWFGVFFILGLAIFFFLTPSLLVKFSILWICVYISPFLNLISVQQFVTERYAWLPSMGLCFLLSLIGGSPIYWIAFGIYLMRTWAHLPTYRDELSFYQSNIWNFPKSEVAYGNMGVTQLRMGLYQSALDSWMISGNINPDYDVPFYNIYSHYKSNGVTLFQQGKHAEGIELLKMAAEFLQKALNSKTCHFRKEWEIEIEQIRKSIQDPFSMLLDEFCRIRDLLESLKKRLETETDDMKTAGINTSIQDHQIKIAQLTEIIGRDLKSIDQQLEANLPDEVRINLIRRRTYINQRIQGKIHEQNEAGSNPRGQETQVDPAHHGNLVSSQSI